MKSQRAQLWFGAIMIMVGALLVMTQAARAQVAFPLAARDYTAWLVRAMDSCTAPTITVVNPSGQGLPNGGCPQTNTTTDSTLGETFALLRVTHAGKLTLLGLGFRFGDLLRVHMTLRVTRLGITTDIGTKTVTFADQPIDCPAAPDVFTPRPNGSLIGNINLSDCLAPYNDLDQGNIQILDASLVNVTNRKTLAVPGVLRH